MRHDKVDMCSLLIDIAHSKDEANKPDDTPSRGRLLEMPGELMPGTWKAQVLDDETEGCSYKRISLRHENVEYSSLEARLQEDNVSIVNPHKNRVTSFIDQEILYDEEIDDTEGEEKVLGKVFIGCVSLVWFDGFYTSTDAIKLANETSEGLLKLCVPPEDSGANSLCKIVRKDLSGKADDFDCVGGVLYRCKLDFDDEYTILLSYSGFEIDAVDGKFCQAFCVVCLNSLSNIWHLYACSLRLQSSLKRLTFILA
jgi:hypothetical protein